MTRPHFEFNENHVPLAYLITFGAYGTWLHGDNRGSVDRFHNRYGTPRLFPNAARRRYETGLLKASPTRLGLKQRSAVERAIRETCSKRNWLLWAFNIRTNHVHTVVSALCNPRYVLNAFKANATRTMREDGCWNSDLSPWSRRGSKRRIWTEKQLANAIAYVEYDQGEPILSD